MKKIFPLSLIAVILLFGCSEKNQKNIIAKTINHQWLDSIVKRSDSTYSKPYKRTDFVTAYFYVNKKDSSVCQVMKDSADSIRQIIIARKNIRTFFAQYFPNGNLEADLPLDEFGQEHGRGTFYFEDGSVQSSGVFNHGLKAGEWKIYDENGKLKYADKYDQNGQAIQPATH